MLRIYPGYACSADEGEGCISIGDGRVSVSSQLEQGDDILRLSGREADDGFRAEVGAEEAPELFVRRKQPEQPLRRRDRRRNREEASSSP